MQIPGLAGRTVPLPALIAIAGLGLAGCVLLVVAVLSGRGGAAARSAPPPAVMTRPPHTSVPTVIHTETPVPTDTATRTPVPTATDTPADTATPKDSPTPTATFTPTHRPTSSTPRATTPPQPTSPPQPTATNTQASVVTGGGGHGLTGQLSLCNPKPSYAAKSDTFEGERICVNELITNTGGETVTYGVLGVQATNLSGGAGAYQSSWRGDLSVPPGGNGPTGSGWQDGLYLTAGSYRLSLSICYSKVDECVNGGDWETLTPGIQIEVVPWTP